MVGDHTPNDSEGNYMLVNAASTPGTVYVDTATNLCGNTVYQLGVWVTSVMTKFACDGNPVLPDLKFQVKTLSGTLLGEDSTGYLPIVNERQWKIFGLSFQTPNNITAVIISISINPKFGCGSAFAIDDITLAPCSPSIISATINGSTGPVDECADYTDVWNLNATYTPGFTDPEFQWQSSVDSGKTWTDIPGETTLFYKVPHRLSGTILYRICIAEKGNISSVNCRITSNEIHTGVHPLPESVPPETVFGCIDKNFYFPPADPKALKVSWVGPNGYSSTDFGAVIPAVSYKDTGLYKLKETFDFGCVLFDTFYLNVFPGTTISVSPTYPICEGMTENLLASSSGGGTYKWAPAAGLSNDTIPNPVAHPDDSTRYKVVVTNSFGCKDSALVSINVYKKPVANAGPDKSINLGDTVTLDGSVKGTSVDFYWSPSAFINDIHSITPKVYPPEDGLYTLTASSNLGCGTSASLTKVRVFRDIYVPNAFTPNGDGKNDRFHVLAADNYKEFKLRIYNRWGQLVYETNDINKGWNGRFGEQPQPSDVYIYYLQIRTASNKEISKKGTFALLR
jgi:gliding motility-associated-like protein